MSGQVTARPAGPPSLRPPGARRPPSPPARRHPAVDPRIAARRVAVRRDEGRRRLRRLVWLLGAAALAVAAALVLHSPALDVDHVRVRGTERLDAGAVVDVVADAGAGRGTQLVDVDTAAVERALAALPAVAEAQVARRWPGTLAVTVVEREPVALVPATGGIGLVADDGVVLDVVAAGAVPPGLPALEGPAAVEEAGAVVDAGGAVAVAAALPDAVRPAVAAVVAAGGGEVELRLAGSGIARLGPATDLAAKLTALATVVDQVDLGCLAVLDVRVATAPVLTRDEGCIG